MRRRSSPPQIPAQRFFDDDEDAAVAFAPRCALTDMPLSATNSSPAERTARPSVAAKSPHGRCSPSWRHMSRNLQDALLDTITDIESPPPMPPKPKLMQLPPAAATSRPTITPRRRSRLLGAARLPCATSAGFGTPKKSGSTTCVVKTPPPRSPLAPLSASKPPPRNRADAEALAAAARDARTATLTAKARAASLRAREARVRCQLRWTIILAASAVAFFAALFAVVAVPVAAAPASAAPTPTAEAVPSPPWCVPPVTPPAADTAPLTAPFTKPRRMPIVAVVEAAREVDRAFKRPRCRWSWLRMRCSLGCKWSWRPAWPPAAMCNSGGGRAGGF